MSLLQGCIDQVWICTILNSSHALSGWGKYIKQKEESPSHEDHPPKKNSN
jgi:hypothetical protein